MRRSWLWAVLAFVLLVGLLAVVVALAPFDWQPDPEGADGPWPYVAVFALVFGDAVIAVLPGETTLNTASTLAAQGYLDLGWVMVAGAAGAVLGDSALYWIARQPRSRRAPLPRLRAAVVVFLILARRLRQRRASEAAG